jgi:hypothetical protein
VIHTIPESVHAILSPSKAHMWLACMGALAATKGLPNKPSKYAAEGTVYHDVSRRALTEDKGCDAYIGDRYKVGEFEFIVDADNAEAAQSYVDRVRAIPGKRFVEVDLEYSALLGVPKYHDITEGTSQQEFEVPVAAGTGDCVIIDTENHLIWGIDLKFGRGDVVYADKNPQLRLYVAAAIARYEMLGITDDWTAVCAVDQPRIHHFDSERITVGELRAWVTEQRQKAQGAYSLWTAGPDQPNLLAALTPGEKQCRWCPLSGNCQAQNDAILNRFPKGHASAAVPTLPQLDDVQLAEALDRADEIASWLSAVRSEALQRAMQGHVLPNWKLVEGRRGNRQLDETARVQLDVAALTEIGVEEAAEASALPVEDAIHFALGDGAYAPKKLKTVAQLQKPLEKRAPLLWAALQAHVTQSDGKPSLERIEDPRPPLANVGAEFPLAEASASSLV